MHVSIEDSNKYISELAQHPPFRFVDRVLELSEQSIVTELFGATLPNRHTEGKTVETYTMLEFAAQSSGMILRNLKEKKRGVISSFRNIKRVIETDLMYPIKIESKLIEMRHPFYTFDFSVMSHESVALSGSISIYIG